MSTTIYTTEWIERFLICGSILYHENTKGPVSLSTAKKDEYKTYCVKRGRELTEDIFTFKEPFKQSSIRPTTVNKQGLLLWNLWEGQVIGNRLRITRLWHHLGP